MRPKANYKGGTPWLPRRSGTLRRTGGHYAERGDEKENSYSFKITTKLTGFEFRLKQIDEFGFPESSKSVKISQ